MHSLAGAEEVLVRPFRRTGGMRGNAVAREVICVIAAGGCHRVLGCTHQQVAAPTLIAVVGWAQRRNS